MRIKGFFWFLTTLLTAICLYQLSFTWVANGVESDAQKKANKIVDSIKREALANDNGIVKFPLTDTSKTVIDFNKPGSDEYARTLVVNNILREKADLPVYPIFGFTFQEVKSWSLGLGLDLVGGMSVTMEIDVPGFIKTQVKSENDYAFIEPFEKASQKCSNNSSLDFIDVFVEEYSRINEGLPLNSIFKSQGIGVETSDADVVTRLRSLLDKSIDGIDEVMRRRIDQFGVSTPNIQKDVANKRIYIELPGVQDDETVANRLKATANLEFYEIIYLYKILEDGTKLSDPTLGNNWNAANSLVSQNDTSDENSSELIFEEPSSSVKTLEDFIVTGVGGSVGYAKNKQDKELVDEILNRPEIKSLFGPEVRFMWGANEETFDEDGKYKGWALHACRVPDDGKAKLNGSHLDNAEQNFDPRDGSVIVNLEMNDEGTDLWARMTLDNRGRQVAVTMDNIVYSAPVVQSVINDGRTRISGNYSLEEATDFANLLNGGALPAPLIVKDKVKVGPTIGKENSRAGLLSFVIAFLIVLVYMYFYYGRAGLVADIALLANIIFIFGALASFSAILTLAGIAGIVLTIGMAVDANVLIFERIREEQTKGKDLSSAVQTGYQKALSSIIDANVTTLLTAIVLFYFGAGPIKSFANTLIIGIFSSLFAALIFSRLIIEWWIGKGWKLSFSTKITRNAFKNMRINFLDKRKVTYVISAFMIVGSIFLLWTKGLSKSVEFTGGRTYTVTFEKPASDQIEFIKGQLSSSMPNSSIEVKTKKTSNMVEIKTNYLVNNDNASEEVKTQVVQAMEMCKTKMGDYTIEPDSRFVSPTISGELVQKSLISILLGLLIIFGYIFIRFGKWQFSISASVALFNDVIIVLGLFSLLGGILPFNMDIDQAFVAAILTVIGYSINDTVVVFDRIREDLSWKVESDFKSEINGALNSTLSRTINTSMTTLVVLLIIFFFGGAAIKGFIFALIIGILVGTYSSMFVATPLLVDFTKKIKLR